MHTCKLVAKLCLFALSLPNVSFLVGKQAFSGERDSVFCFVILKSLDGSLENREKTESEEAHTKPKVIVVAL